MAALFPITGQPITGRPGFAGSPTYNGSANLYCAIAALATASARRGATGKILSAIVVNPNSGKRGGATARALASVTANGNSGKRSGSISRVLSVVSASGNPSRRFGSTSRIILAVRESSVASNRFGALAKLIAVAKENSTGARVPPVIVEPSGKSIMRNKIRVLDNDRYSSRGVQFDGDNSFTVKLTQNEAGRLEIYYDHLLEAGDYVVSCVATISGETPPVISLNVAGTIATMIVSGGGFDREMTIVATTFFGLKDEIRLCIRDYVRPRARPRDY